MPPSDGEMMPPGGRLSEAASFAARDDTGAWLALHESAESCPMRR
jgi:hypothetical protein